jgi:antitoxin component YwqK of YwqJK toxin-antitoxin module
MTEVIRYHDNGEMRERCVVNSRGEKNGKYVTYHSNGIPGFSGNYLDGSEHGTFETWDQNSIPIKTYNMIYGKLDGEYKEHKWIRRDAHAYYNETIIGWYLDGVEHGEFKVIKGNSIRKRYHMVNGVLDGMYTEYRAYKLDNGEQVISSIRNYVNGTERDIKTYGMAGIQTHRIMGEYGKQCIESKEYYENHGGVKTHTLFVKKISEGIDEVFVEQYYVSSRLRTSYTMVGGKMRGEVRKYRDVDQNPLQSVYFTLGNQMNGMFKSYHMSGKRANKCYYVDGVVRGNSQYFYESGAVESEITHDDGGVMIESKSYYENGVIKKIDISKSNCIKTIKVTESEYREVVERYISGSIYKKYMIKKNDIGIDGFYKEYYEYLDDSNSTISEARYYEAGSIVARGVVATILYIDNRNKQIFNRSLHLANILQKPGNMTCDVFDKCPPELKAYILSQII